MIMQTKIILPLENTAATPLGEVPTSIMSSGESIIKKRELYHHWFISLIPNNSVKRVYLKLKFLSNADALLVAKHS
jgi:hypothetical protein